VKVVDLYSLSPTFSLVAAERGHKVLSILREDLDDQVNGERYKIRDKWMHPDVVWTQIPCQTFSLASAYVHWNKDGTPRTEECLFGIKRAKYIISLIEELQPRYFFIENPFGKLWVQDFMQGYHVDSLTYCAYGCSRRKPTKIAHNSNWRPRAMCHPGAGCHEMSAKKARRLGLGRSGTQSLKTKKERADIPRDLIVEILEAIE